MYSLTERVQHLVKEKKQKSKKTVRTVFLPISQAKKLLKFKDLAKVMQMINGREGFEPKSV